MSITDLRKQTMRIYNERNKAKIRYQEAEARDKLRLEMVAAYGGKCLHCEEADPIVLTLDHINDDPEPEYEEAGTSSRGGNWLYGKLKREGWPKERFQLLCFNCNMRKEHKRRRNEMIALYGEPVKEEPVSRGEARAKAGPNTNNSSGFKGVIWNWRRQKWQAGLRKEGQYVFIGRYSSLVEAAKAYREYSRSVWGEIANQLTDEEIETIAAKVNIGASLESKTELSLDELGL